MKSGATTTPRSARTVTRPLAHISGRELAGVAHADQAAETQRTRPQRPAARPQRGLRIGYVIDRFPRASHDFLLQEILALQSRGVEVHVFSLGSPDGRIDETAAAMARVQIPVRYFSSDLASGLAANGMTASQARWVADLVMIRGIEHLHAHGATAPADIARQAGRLARVGYSFTAYADGLYEGADAPSLREKIQDAKFAVTLNNFDRGHLLRICGADVARKLHRVPMGLNPKERPFASAE